MNNPDSKTNRSSNRVIWSACHTGAPTESHFRRVTDHAAREGVQGVELSGRAVDHYIAYRDFPELSGQIDTIALAERQRLLQNVSEHAHARGLRMGVWHHEIYGPKNLLDLMPALRAADGLVDLDQPLLYRFITLKVREFFELFPCVNDLVLTLTETHIPVFRRPFCDIPVSERVRRVLQAILDATEPLEKTLVIRPFSAIREDELQVREAVRQITARNLVIMYKTEPFDWHPFLPNEPLIGSVPHHEARAETDAGAEYYGQSVFPCSYIGHLKHRLSSALEKGATSAVIRVDRGVHHPALGTPINEGNVIASTRWLLGRCDSIEDGWNSWLKDRHHADVPGLLPLLERTFGVIKKSLYIDQQSFTHNLFPSFEQAKHVQAFGLLEEGIPLDHMRHNWAILSGRQTLTHEQIILEKQEALKEANAILSEASGFPGLPTALRRTLLGELSLLPLLAEACLAFCRVAIAHVEEMWQRTPMTTRAFELEAAHMLELAANITREKGPSFWMHMASRMRGIVSELQAERLRESPIRATLAKRSEVADYVLCGFASEGHRLGKLLHFGHTRVFRGRNVRETGTGPEQGFSYRLERGTKPARSLAITFAGESATPIGGIIRIGNTEHPFNLPAPNGYSVMTFPAESPDGVLQITLWSTTPHPIAVAQIEWFNPA